MAIQLLGIRTTFWRQPAPSRLQFPVFSWCLERHQSERGNGVYLQIYRFVTSRHFHHSPKKNTKTKVFQLVPKPPKSKPTNNGVWLVVVQAEVSQLHIFDIICSGTTATSTQSPEQGNIFTVFKGTKKIYTLHQPDTKHYIIIKVSRSYFNEL